MATYTMMVLTNAVEGRDEAFNDWYDNRHIPDVLQVPGFVGATRFLASEVQRDATVPYKYAALYKIDTDDLAGSLQELKARAGSDAMPLSDAMVGERLVTVFAQME